MGVKLGLSHREEHKVGVFDKRALRMICGPMQEEVIGERRILHNEKLHDLYLLPNIIPVIK
jgi:hypothetical protein